MRTIFGTLALSISLVACMGDLLNTNSYPDSQFVGSWSGEVNGVTITFTMDTSTCVWGCSAEGVGSFVRSATGDSGSTAVSILAYNPGVPSQSDFTIDFTAVAADDTELRTSLSAGMPDASHVVGRIWYDDMLQVDTGSTVTFIRK
ncbi:MAG TPA: hypothetical protein VFK04_19050 [Gemmatimonadaceae bacterium]|nr:hypothetical protein [Gemmatimonadaceae bacterium]